MQKSQVLALAKSVKAISDANQKAIDISQALLFENPKLSLAIVNETFRIAEANSKLLDIVKEHAEKYLQNDDESKVTILSGTKTE